MTTTTTAHAAPTATSNENTMGMLAHLLMIFTYWLGPLILYLVKKDQPGFALDQAREALNFGITMTIAMIVAYIVMFATLGILFILPVAVGVAGLVFGILACIAANKGQAYRYPFALRLVK